MIKNNLEIEKILNDISRQGFSIVRKFLDPEDCQSFVTLLENSKNANSNNIIGGSTSSGSYFLSNAIACNDKLLNIIASDAIIDLSAKFLSSQPYLKCHRIYKTSGKTSNFPWHTDNKDKKSKSDMSKGINCILYLNQIEKGGLEVIPNGYYKSKYSKPSNKIIKDFIKKNGTYKFKGDTGDAIFFDQALIHRAAQELFAGKAYSMWFQITDENAVREQLLLKNHQIPSEKDKRYKFLNIGIKSEDFAQPVPKEKQISVRYALKLLILSIPNAFENKIRSFLRPLKYFVRKN